MTSSRNVCLFLAVLIAYDSLAPSQAFELSPTMKKQVAKLKDRCIKQTGASAERMLQAKKDQVLPDDPAFKCFLHCMFDMLGLIDSHNVMQLESLIEVLPEEIHPEINDQLRHPNNALPFMSSSELGVGVTAAAGRCRWPRSCMRQLYAARSDASLAPALAPSASGPGPEEEGGIYHSSEEAEKQQQQQLDVNETRSDWDWDWEQDRPMIYYVSGNATAPTAPTRLSQLQKRLKIAGTAVLVLVLPCRISPRRRSRCCHRTTHWHVTVRLITRSDADADADANAVRDRVRKRASCIGNESRSPQVMIASEFN
ncbi:GL25188 [Drosophila persimilis]|uniref:GL25188 n=1 Tax=Drosophila persimilis TaxID=7234 RepID=B4GRD9_DROPE|nr:GL25188 [Drosophila persimilis]